MHLLQVCNVGQIVGGTAACAWSVTRALPHWQHSIAFLSNIDNATRQAFAPHSLHRWPACTSSRVQQVRPDLVILHNLSAGLASYWDGAMTIQYVHSLGRRLVADRTIYCSSWLAEQCRDSQATVLWQGVPRPPQPSLPRPRTTNRLRIGRICTPTARKWPDALPAFYESLSCLHPQVLWDFVGCPVAQQSRLQEACLGRATFLPAGWLARSHVWEWDALLYHHPSLTESFGRTVADAARAGCHPIVDARGGFVEQVQAIGGRCCSDLAEFTEAIDELESSKTRQADIETMQTSAHQHFSLSAFGGRLSSLVRSLI